MHENQLTIDHNMNMLPQQRLGFISLLVKLKKMISMVHHFEVLICVFYIFMTDYLFSKFDKRLFVASLAVTMNKDKG